MRFYPNKEEKKKFHLYNKNGKRTALSGKTFYL